jgi:hypothetical protein
MTDLQKRLEQIARNHGFETSMRLNMLYIKIPFTSKCGINGKELIRVHDFKSLRNALGY